MKNIKEIQPILAAIYCINRTNGHEDKDIQRLVEYAFRYILGSNTNLLLLACIGKTKENVLLELMPILRKDTNYVTYLEYKKAMEEQQ